MKCTECGNAMTKSIGDHRYVECGLENVILQGIPLYECESCGAKRIVIPAMAQLHRVIARLLAHKSTRLVPQEVAFIRDHLELSNQEFAKLMGVTEEQSSRWTGSDQIGMPAERFLRTLAIVGRDAVARVRGQEPEVIDSQENMGADMIEMVRELLNEPPKKAISAKPLSFGLRRSASTWKSTAINPN